MRATGRHDGKTKGSAVVMALGLAIGACGDDETVDPADTGSTGTDVSTSGGSSGSDGTGSSGGPTSGLDSTGSSGGSTSGVDSTESGESSSTTTVNLPPEPVDDYYFVRANEAPLSVDAASGLLANDVEPEGQGLTVDGADAMSAAGGTVVVQPDGAFEYTPAAGFFGDDSFAYTARDDAGGTAMALVRVSVGPLEAGVDVLLGGDSGFVINGEAADDESGISVGGGGDVNGDGLDDLVVSSVEAGATAGRTWVVFGKAGGTAVELADVTMGLGGFVIDGEAATDEAGHAVAVAGDVNGDGLTDVLVGAPLAGPAGRAYLVFGKADGTAVDLADVAMGIGGFVLEGDGFGEDAGTAVAGAGDVNGDGLDDMLVGAPEGGPIPDGGRTYVVHGKVDTAAVALSDVFLGVGGFAIHGVGFDDNSGDSVAGPGDVDGDGLADVLVGARLANAGGLSNSGRCYVVFGKTTTGVVDLSVLGNDGFTISGETDLDEACTAIAGAGDVNGDGLADLAVTAPAAENDQVLQGRAYVVHGKANSTPVLLTDVVAGVGGYVIDGEAVGDLLGLSIGGGNDLDADGFGDVVIGTPNVDIPGIFAGRGYVVFGKNDPAPVPLADLPMGTAGFSITASGAQDWLGWRVSAAGDVDGDGYGDVIVAANRADAPAGASAGRSFVLFGGNYRGATTHQGLDSDDVIVATPGMDIVVAGAGNDEIYSEGGSDVINGGAGDDLIALVGGQFFRLDGGSGFDTMAFDDGGVVFDLGLVSNIAIRNIEAIDLTGTGDNSLTFGYDDLRAMVGPSHTLQLLGDALDTAVVDLSGAGFANMGSAGGVTTYANGAYTLEVVDPLVAQVML